MGLPGLMIPGQGVEKHETGYAFLGRRVPSKIQSILIAKINSAHLIPLNARVLKQVFVDGLPVVYQKFATKAKLLNAFFGVTFFTPMMSYRKKDTKSKK